MKISLTNREADVMQVLWDHGPATIDRYAAWQGAAEEV